jgi:hypothetical protein
MKLDRSWPTLEARLRDIAEGAVDWSPHLTPSDQDLDALGLVQSDGTLTQAGNDYYFAKFVLHDHERASEALADVLQHTEVVTTFCGALWGRGEIPVRGAVSLLKRVTASQDELSAKRWLEFMNAGRFVAYNRPTLRVLFNPSEIASPGEEAVREKSRGHIISPTTPYGNLAAIRELVRSARGSIRWYEQHMPAKVLEVLYRQVEKGNLTDIRILSGPANIDEDLRADFKRFRAEMKKQRGIEVEWRVLSPKESFKHHDRHFLSEGIARNLPPLNSILAGRFWKAQLLWMTLMVGGYWAPTS